MNLKINKSPLNASEVGLIVTQSGLFFACLQVGSAAAEVEWRKVERWERSVETFGLRGGAIKQQQKFNKITCIELCHKS